MEISVFESFASSLSRERERTPHWGEREEERRGHDSQDEGEGEREGRTDGGGAGGGGRLAVYTVPTCDLKLFIIHYPFHRK